MNDQSPAAEITQAKVFEALRDVYDPEIPVNIVDLGLVYDVNVQESRVHVKMTEDGIAKMWLDLADMTVDRVRTGNSSRPFTHRDGRLDARRGRPRRGEAEGGGGALRRHQLLQGARQLRRRRQRLQGPELLQGPGLGGDQEREGVPGQGRQGGRAEDVAEDSRRESNPWT